MKSILCIIGAMLGPASASAQIYPVKPIRFIVPFPAGGATDFVSRTLAQKLTNAWGQQVVVDNRGGAGGVIGVQLAARAAHDGYTLLLASSSNFAFGPALTPELPYDPIRDFLPVTLVVLVPNILVAHPSLPVQSMKDLIQMAKSHPGQITYASPGVATTSHIAGELMNRAAGIRMLHVPYKGGGPALTDVLAGQVQMLFGGISTSLPMVRAGKLRALGVTSARRVAAAPDVPAIAEAGLPGYEVVQWFGVSLPAATPNGIVKQLNAALAKILALPEVKDRFAQQGLEATSQSSEAFAAYIGTETARWSKLFREVGLQGTQLR